ncbi:MAG TPA: DUF4271 domain-containing protein [Chitinophaga sp.]|nr:DUF4271 domain-containing protein [Chitinophaga sp.]
MRSWLLFLFIIPCLRLAAQTDTTVKPAQVVTQPVRRDTSRPVKRTAPVIRRDSSVAAVRPAAIRRDSSIRAGVPASVVRRDSSAAPGGVVTDSLSQQAVVPLHQETAYEKFLKGLNTTNVYLRNKSTRLDVNKLRVYDDLDWLVYVMAGTVLLLGIIRMSYMKYFSDLFKAFMNPTLSQRQLKDQLSQSPFPNFLLNSFFVISLALYLYLLMYRQQYIPGNTAWMAIPGLIVLVAVVYGVKYVMLRFCGWLFGSSELADAYIFILYLINKVLGVLLVPFLVILAFCQPGIAKAFIYISVFFIVLLVAYRYIRSYSVVKQYLSFSRLHFFLYLCAFEVAPVLIITKVLLVALTGGH